MNEITVKSSMACGLRVLRLSKETGKHPQGSQLESHVLPWEYHMYIEPYQSYNRAQCALLVHLNNCSLL